MAGRRCAHPHRAGPSFCRASPNGTACPFCGRHLPLPEGVPWRPLEPTYRRAKAGSFVVVPGLYASTKGVPWEVDSVGPAWVNLRSVAGEDARLANGRAGRECYLDDEQVVFGSEATTGRTHHLKPEAREALLREVRGSIAEVQRTILASEGRFTANEQRVLSDTVQSANAATNEDSGDDVLWRQLLALQRTADVTGPAMIR